MKRHGLKKRQGVDMRLNDKNISVRFSRRGLKQRNRELSILYEMSNFLSTSMNLEALLTGALSQVMTYFQLEAGRIYLLDENRQYLNLAACKGLEPAGLEKVSLREGFSGKAARTKSFIAQHVEDLEDKRRVAFLKDRGIRVVICVPLIAMDQVGGVMNLATGREIELTQSDIDLLTAIGNQIAVASNDAKLYEELEKKIEILKEKKEMIKFFAYSVSHDLKSPVTGIYGLAKRLKERYTDVLDERGQGYCDQLQKASEHLVALVENLNAFIHAKEATFRVERVDVKEILASLRNEYAESLDARKIIWVVPGTIPEIMADKTAVTRLFRNLLDNAMKYGGESLGKLTIGYQESETHHIFSFSDDGVGIRDDERAKIFEKFERRETSRGLSGTGLGLASVREIAERHGGQARLEGQEEGGGTTFSVSVSKQLTDD
jgi:K+-sensing histidine kinase KdpD